MKHSRRILLALTLTALCGQPAFAAFGDNPTAAADALAGDGAAGSALPPGTYPSSPSDRDKKTQESDQQQTDKTSKPADSDSDTKPPRKPRSGS
ncbi:MULTISPECIES: hypothetical protein [unclassified Pseudomonas]|uniref:hypothetical protein n=1 Tax=unclassified Pseudomonas TaxID=196821 RepID=UPI002002CCB6|nr:MULTISPECIES: hypothetical protein [unclassified Pseudomonas]MCK6190535.1 hypothetical protein [Pseudomonas sp. EYE_354]WLH66437.1 hypothetical protein PSH59_14920 [Pseudomonas sp. FP2309]